MLSMTEITITVGGLVVSAVVVILTTIIFKLFSRYSSNNGDGSGDGVDTAAGGLRPLVPIIIPNTSIGSWKYDVFLSFRGEDTRKNFVDHLYSALGQHGILTYKDDVTLDRGDTIGPSLLKAIEESQISVIIFSENYADSSWCLDELSYIMKCKDSKTGQIVFPIFYHVDPSDVRKQKGQFGKAFSKHELSENSKNKVETWKKALVDASNIAGWEPKHVANGHEAKCIQEIVDSILGKLSSLNPVVEDEELVGMETRLKDLKQLLRIGSGGVRTVGIWGLGGGGKTTLATSLYMEISGLFDGCCFLDNIRVESKQQNGLKVLQEKFLSAVFGKQMQVESVDIGKHTIKRMLCRRKVLIVLDDVDHIDQLKALAGCHAWFGDGSRIIITTRDQHLLITHKVDEVCPVILLSKGEAIRLFRRHAYHENNPVQDYEKLSLLVISYGNGLPLALKILGSFLYDKNKDEWLSTLSRLKDHPEMDIVEKLKISYDGLKPVEKELFLDIACFFRGRQVGEAMRILDACGFHSCIGVKVLTQKALITVSHDVSNFILEDVSNYGWFDMHDLVQEMAHYIVRGEHPNNPEKHSRVWRYEDIEDMCSRNATTGNDNIEGMRYHLFYPSNFIRLISKMKKLRFLEVNNTYTSVDEMPRFLSNELRYLYWESYPASLFPEGFSPPKLAILIMERSLQKEFWNGYKYLPSLKELQLKDARVLVRTPDFGGLPCLQKLILEECERLEEIHQSLGNHNSLVCVHVKDCRRLTRFPSIVQMDKLGILEISGCKELVEFPKIEAKMDSLIELTLKSVGIKVLPSSVGEYCTNLISLKLGWCDELKSIEGRFHELKCLEKFAFEHCSQFEKLPKDLLNENLDRLGLSLYSMGSTIRQLILPRCLRTLNLGHCYLEDGEIPNEVGQLSGLQELDLRFNFFTRLDFSLSRLTSLKLLELSGCQNLVELPELPSSLAILRADICRSLNAIVSDDIDINCKCLCGVSIWGGRENKIGGERLIENMIQGISVESGCISLQLNGDDIFRGFEPGLVRGERCRIQLPKNWYNDFSGFLVFCTTSNLLLCRPEIIMKHEKLEGGSTGGMKDSQDEVVYLEDSDDVKSAVDCVEKSKCTCTWMGYIPFGSLRSTLWWQDHQTSTAIQIDYHFVEECIYQKKEFESDFPIGGCGFKLIPKRSKTSITYSSSFHDVYTCRLRILHDSKSALKCFIPTNFQSAT